MGIFDFMKKRDPLDDLTLPEDPVSSNPFSNDIHPAAEQNNFTPPDLNQFGSTQQQDTFAAQNPNQSFGDPTGFDMPQQSQFEQPGYSPGNNANSFGTPAVQAEVTSRPNTARDHELELINSKLDTIRALMEGLGQRISGMESRLSIESERRRRQW
jgi:hypothetical protein